jgi:hypothetical protein
MKKIPTLFKREFLNGKVGKVLPEITEGLEFVLYDEDIIPLVKWDGSCCAIINNEFYRRYDAKNGKPIPEGAIKCQDKADPITGHLPCWIKCDENNPSDKWYIYAYEPWKHYYSSGIRSNIEYQTFEVIGRHFRGNPYKLDGDILIPHNSATNIIVMERPLTFKSIEEYLSKHHIEGIVFWKDNQPICKIKSSDFGIDWRRHI